jgi:hypothetical protein
MAGEPVTDRACPNCGGPMTTVQTGCPDGRLGCLVMHWGVRCDPCEQRRWDEHDRPATIGELGELRAQVGVIFETIARLLG